MEIDGFVHQHQVSDPPISAFLRSGNGPTLVLIPGTWGPAAHFEEAAKDLDPDLNLILLEVPGQGDNWPPPKNATMGMLTEYAYAALEHLGVERFYLGGHSLGGMMSVEMLRICPDRLLGIIPIEGWTHHSVAEDAFHGAVTSTLNDEQMARREDIRRQVLDRWDEDERLEFAKIWRRWDGYELLATTDVPVLEIWGDRGAPIPSLKDMKIPHRPNIDIHWVNGASHSLLMEAPGEVAAAINRFIARIEETRQQ